LILVDSSVWIDYLRGAATPQTNRLDELLGREPLVIGDLILSEVLQGIDKPRDFEKARRLLTSMEVVTLGGADIAIQAAAQFRRLRRRGITVRKTIDCMIATWCIANGCALLHADRDFDAYEQHLGLTVVPSRRNHTR